MTNEGKIMIWDKTPILYASEHNGKIRFYYTKKDENGDTVRVYTDEERRND